MNAVSASDRERAWSGTAALQWEDGVTAGTGVAGAVVFGRPAEHVVVVSHERGFLPVNSRRPAPDLTGSLDEMRDALTRGDPEAAADVLEARLREQDIDPDELVWTDPLVPLARIVVVSENQDDTGGYRREIDLDAGGCSVEWQRAEGARTGFALDGRHGDSGFDLTIWSDELARFRVELRPVVESRAGWDNPMVVDYSSKAEAEVTADATEQAIRITAVESSTGGDWTAHARITAPDAMPPHPDGGWQVTTTAGHPLTLRIAVDAPGDVSLDDLDERALLAASRLTLTASDLASRSTEDWWQRARAGDADAERMVIETAYRAGRRNVVASTGALPPTLQGVWSGTWTPAWSADYTLNGNLEHGPFAGVLSTGLAELMPSLFRLVRPFMDDYRENARRIFGVEGLMLPARLTTHGHANHFNRDYPHLFWVGCGPWILRLAVDYVQVTGDRRPLDEWVWDFARGVVEFALGVLESGDGTLSPSYSPENTPAGSANPLATDATADIAAIRDALALGAWLAELRDERALAASWREARDRARPYAVAVDGTLAEWSGAWPEQLAHRHTSQLYGLWYEPDERFLTVELRAAALATVRAKVAWRAEKPTAPPGRMEMAFGLASIGMAAAALGDAESAYQCALWLARDHFTPALMSTHDAGVIFNLDASGALPGLVAAMLAESTVDTVSVLPALPAAWPHGSITGLTARGAVRIDELSWTPHGIEVNVSAPAEGDWLRPDGFEVRFPRPVELVEASGARLVSRTAARVPPGVRSASLRVEFVR